MPLASRAVARSQPVEGDAYIIPAYTGPRGALVDELACNSLGVSAADLTEALRALRFKGASGDASQCVLQIENQLRTCVLVGLGEHAAVGASECRVAGAAASKMLAAGASAYWPRWSLPGDHESSAALVEGALLGPYSIPTSAAGNQADEEVELAFASVGAEAMRRGQILANACALARDLTNAPPSDLGPSELTAQAEEIASNLGLACRVWDESALRQEGFGGCVAVGGGSSDRPRMIRLDFSSGGEGRRLGLVGKAVTFDSGGVNAKTDAEELRLMKLDKAGGAAVLAAIAALPALGVATNVTALLMVAENMPSGGAYRPGDIVTHFGGLTTEVTNTDSEGRLLLADGLAYLSRNRFDAIIDTATLTDSVRLGGLGDRISALLSNDQELTEMVVRAGALAGEPVWPLPLDQTYLDRIESAVADVRQEGTTSAARPIAVALFLSKFVPETQPWCHLEIGGTAYADELGGGAEATGVPARTLIRLAELLDRGDAKELTD